MAHDPRRFSSGNPSPLRVRLVRDSRGRDDVSAARNFGGDRVRVVRIDGLYGVLVGLTLVAGGLRVFYAAKGAAF